MNHAIANAVVRAHRHGLGRGPPKAHAFHRGNIVVVLLRNPLTVLERALVADGNRGAVRHLREQFADTLAPQLVDSVQTLTGCTVEAFLSATHVEPDLVAELFVLDRPVP